MPRALVTLLIASCCAEESIWLRRKHWVWADATNQILVPGCSHEDAMTRQWTAELTAIMCPALPLDAACADRAAATLSAASVVCMQSTGLARSSRSLPHAPGDDKKKRHMLFLPGQHSLHV